MILKVDFDSVKAEAEKRAEQMLKNEMYDRFRENYATRLEHAMIGCMGEIAFEGLLAYYNMPYETDREGFENRNADEFDFQMNGYKVDIKVAKTDYTPKDSWTYGYPQEQSGMVKDLVVVGWVSEKRKCIGMYGWIPFSEIQKYPLLERNSFAGYKYKTPNYEFPWGDLNKNFGQFFDLVYHRNGRG